MENNQLSLSAEKAVRLWREWPDSFAARASNGKWMPYRWLQYLSDRISDGLIHGGGRYLVEAPPQHGKLLAHDTPVLTADGWKKHGELRPGDLVVHPSGRFIRVLALSPDGYADHSVQMTNGETFFCHGRHEWTVIRDRKRGTLQTIETQEMGLFHACNGNAGHRGSRYRFQLPLSWPVIGTEKDLPVAPYALGAWLGDGTRVKPAISVSKNDEAIIQGIIQSGYRERSRWVYSKTKVVTVAFDGLWDGLKKAGVANINGRFRPKLIPDQYLTASINQRLELLAGLIDTDGYAYSKNGRHVFTTSEPELADSFCALLSSFGWSFSRVKEKPRLSSSGIQGKSEYWVIGFNPDRPIPCRLSRKQVYKPTKRRRVAIKSIKRLEMPIAGRCIQVDSPDGLYLVGRTLIPTHNSEFISHWVPTWFLNRFPNKKVILASYAQDYATKWGAKVREELSLNPLAAIPMRIDTKAKKRFMTADGGQMITAGIGGPVTGEGADLLIIDDPFKNYEEAMSERIRQRNWDWWESVARTRLQPGATVIILHTRWHEDDLIGRLSEDPQWEKIHLPAMAEENDAMGRKPGEALCPERYDEKHLEQLKRDLKEGLVWWALFQQSPVTKGGNIIRGDWIQRYTSLPKDIDEIAIFADLTYEEGEENDYTVVEAWGRKGADIYLIAQIRSQMGFGDQCEAIVRMKALYPKAYHIEIEKKANGAAVIETVKKKIPGIFANNPKTSKEARLHAVAPIYQAKNVYYPDLSIAPWIKENLNEITKFPRAKHDDTVDVATMAVGYFGQMASTLQKLAAMSKR